MVDRRGIEGGLALWWTEEVEIQILSYFDNHIDTRWDGEIKQRITLFYGSPYIQKRINSWQLLRTLCQHSDLPWLVFGDFNEVCFSWEVIGTRIRG